MKVITPVYKFINSEIIDQSFNSREKSVYALKFLYCFLEFTKTSIENLDQNKIELLKLFLLGYSLENGTYNMELQTVRSNSTVNGYLNIYRSFFNYLNVEIEYLLKTKTTNILKPSSMYEKYERIQKYESNLKTGSPKNIVPKYISVKDFSKIIKEIRKDNNLKAECIVRLMYQFGLRIGEVLGLTFEDLTEIQLDNKLYPVLYIRNRLSDKPFQKAKSCMVINNNAQYKSKDYKIENYGYQKVIITYDIYELINNYIDKHHSKIRKNKNNKYENNVVADKIVRNKYIDKNYYIFMNSIGSILSNQSWNKYIKKIFRKANLSIDKGIKENNLNHRFRHGFAMFHVKHKNTSLIKLQKLMRHASVSSTMVYFNFTSQDEADIKNDFVNELYDLIPSLKEMPKI
jgi:integrase/recombinase XerD